MAATRFNDNSIISHTCYQPIYDDNKKIIKENVFTNSLNVLGYIPGISTISGIARMLFAVIMLLKTADNDQVAISHYKRHIARGVLEIVPVVSNIAMLISDIMYVIFLKWKETSIKDPNAQDTEHWYTL